MNAAGILMSNLIICNHCFSKALYASKNSSYSTEMSNWDTESSDLVPEANEPNTNERPATILKE